MNGVQKTIKYIALAFAMFLSISIIGSCAFAILRFAEVATILPEALFRNGRLHIENLKDLDDIDVKVKDKIRIEIGDDMFGERKTKSFVKEFSPQEAAKVRKLELDNYDGALTVIRGETLKIEAKDVPERYVAELRNDVLYLGYNESENLFINITLWNRVQPMILLTIPPEVKLTTTEIRGGSGPITIEELSTDSFSMNNGSGASKVTDVQVATKLDIKSGSGAVTLTAVNTGETNINSGSGRVVMKDCLMGDVEVDSGSGSISFDGVTTGDLELNSGSGRTEFKNGRINGDISLDCGSGGVSIQAEADINDYNVACETGSGGIWLNGVKLSDGYREKNSNAKHTLEIDGASGRVSIELTTSKDYFVIDH